MGQKERKTKRWGEGDSVQSPSSPKIEEKPLIPYKLNQVCVDVKIVELHPENERCIGFVYVKRDGNGAVIKERTAKHGRVVILDPVWDEKVQWMTLSDFDGFLEARKKCFTL